MKMNSMFKQALAYTTLGVMLAACGPKPQPNKDLETRVESSTVPVEVLVSDELRYFTLIQDAHTLLDRNLHEMRDSTYYNETVSAATNYAHEAQVLGERLEITNDPGLDELWANVHLYKNNMNLVYGYMVLMLDHKDYGKNFDKEGFAKKWAANLDEVIKNGDFLPADQLEYTRNARAYLSNYIGGNNEN